MKAINARRDIFSFVMVVFPHCSDAIGNISIINEGMSQLDVKMELACFDKASRMKGKKV